MTITRIAPMSVARIAGVLYAILGLCLGLVFSAMTMLGGGADAGGMTGMNPMAGMAFGTAAVFVLPLVYGFFGFMSTLFGEIGRAHV